MITIKSYQSDSVTKMVFSQKQASKHYTHTQHKTAESTYCNSDRQQNCKLTLFITTCW